MNPIFHPYSCWLGKVRGEGERLKGKRGDHGQLLKSGGQSHSEITREKESMKGPLRSGTPAAYSMLYRRGSEVQSGKGQGLTQNYIREAWFQSASHDT